jgi:CRISPR-associated endoribonuclease Cas6/Csy4 subtype I-F
MVGLSHYLRCEVEGDGGGISSGVLLGAAVMRAHLAAAGRFAVAFPEAVVAPARAVGRAASPSLGQRLEIFAEPEILAVVATGLEELEHYLSVRRARPVRSPVAFASYRRVREAVRTKATVTRELRRAERRATARGQEIEESEKVERAASLRNSCLPYVHLVSLSTGRRFAIRVERLEASVGCAGGGFDAYGFGRDGATVPVLG